MPLRFRTLLPSRRYVAFSCYENDDVSQYLTYWQWGRVTWAYKMVQTEGR